MQRRCNSMTIGEKIKFLRKEKGLTQKELSERSDIPVITIRQYEAEKYNPKTDAVFKLCVGLDCKITDLIDDEQKKFYRYFDCIPLPKEAEKKTQKNISIETYKYLPYIKNSDLKDNLLTIVNFLLDQLNTEGKKEAVKRVFELTEIKRYEKDIKNDTSTSETVTDNSKIITDSSEIITDNQ